MNCKHCQSAVEQALEDTPGVRSAEVLLDERLVKVDGEIDGETVLKRLKKAGYAAKKIES